MAEVIRKMGISEQTFYRWRKRYAGMGVAELAPEIGILLVFDEVITGFGRLEHGPAQAFGVVPDVITMAKAITNGTQPMGAVAVKNEIYETIVQAAAPGAVEFFHGYTYSAHPCSCAAARATFEIYRREALFERASELTPFSANRSCRCEVCPESRT